MKRDFGYILYFFYKDKETLPKILLKDVYLSKEDAQKAMEEQKEHIEKTWVLKDVYLMMRKVYFHSSDVKNGAICYAILTCAPNSHEIIYNNLIYADLTDADADYDECKETLTISNTTISLGKFNIIQNKFNLSV